MKYKVLSKKKKIYWNIFLIEYLFQYIKTFSVL